MKRKTASFLVLLVLAGLAAGCAKEPPKGGAVPPSPPPTETQQADGSTLTVTEASGIKSEVRFFPKGDVSQVSRASRPDGRRAVSVKFRDGRTADLREPADIDRAIEASNEEIAAMALKVLGAAPAGGEAKKDTP